jgi:hypothetical protein
MVAPLEPEMIDVQPLITPMTREAKLMAPDFSIERAELIGQGGWDGGTYAHNSLMHSLSCTLSHALPLMHSLSCTPTHALPLMHSHSCTPSHALPQAKGKSSCTTRMWKYSSVLII